MDWLNPGAGHTLCPAAAMGIKTALLNTPPALICANAKQSGVMFAGKVKLICQSPGYPEEVPAYSGVICVPATFTMKLPAAVWSPELPPVSLSKSAPPPHPQNTSVSPGCAGPSVQLYPPNATLPLVNRVRLIPPLTLPSVACGLPGPPLFAGAGPGGQGCLE